MSHLARSVPQLWRGGIPTGECLCMYVCMHACMYVRTQIIKTCLILHEVYHSFDVVAYLLMCMYVCMHAFMWVWECMQACVCVWVDVHACVCASVYLYTFVILSFYVRAHNCAPTVWVSVHAYICVCVCSCTCVTVGNFVCRCAFIYLFSFCVYLCQNIKHKAQNKTNTYNIKQNPYVRNMWTWVSTTTAKT